MATVKLKKNTAFETRKLSKLAWAAGTPEQWQTYGKQNDIRSGVDIKFTSTSLTTQCINGHSDSNPSMIINPQKGFVKCYSCGYYEWNCVRFWSKFTGKSHAVVAKDLQAELGVKLATKTNMKAMEDEFLHTKIKNGMAKIFNEELCEAQRVWEECDKNVTKFEETEYGYSLITLQYLEERGLSDYLHILPIGLFCTTRRLAELAESDMRNKKRVYDPQEVLAMEKYFRDFAKVYYLGSLVLVYHSTPIDVASFRLRVVKPTDPAKNIVAIKDPREGQIGIFGLGMYGSLTGKGSNSSGEGIGSTTKCIVVEGEFDQMQYAVRAAEVGNNDIIMLSHAGASNREISEITNFGLKNVYYIPDHDNGGDINAKEVMKVNPGLGFKIFAWPTDILDTKKSKMDLDDSLNLYGFQTVHDHLMDWEKNWLKPTYWCREQVKKELAQKGVEDDDFTSISKTVFSFAPCIGDSSQSVQASEINSWVKETLTELGVATDAASSLTNDFMAKDSDEDVFCARFIDALHAEFEFIAVDRDASTLPVTVWYKKKKVLTEIRVGSDQSVKSALCSMLGTLLSWTRDKISIPFFIRSTVDKTGEMVERSILLQEEDLGKFAILALKEIVSRLNSSSSYKLYRQGCHWLPTKKGNQLFCVNGNSVYRTSYGSEGTETEMLTSPIYDGLMFSASGRRWSDNIDEDTYGKPQKSTLSERMEKVISILKTGWTFKDQNTEPLGLASFIVASAVMKIYPKNMQFLASNERSTGKSTLYAELIGGGKGTEINLVEHSRFVDNATPAGVRQSMDGSTLTLCLDEFDNQSGSGRRSERNSELMLILRASSEGEGVMSQGTVSGKSKDFHLSFSAFVSGIDPNVEEANMTRFFTTDLQSGLDNRRPPSVSILDEWTLKSISDLRKSITLDSLHDVPMLLQSYNTVKHECDVDPDILGVNTLQRFKDNMFVLASVLHAAGMDWKTWAINTRIAKQDALKDLKKRTANDVLFESVFHTPNVDTGNSGGKKKMVVKFFETVHNDTDLATLNNSGCGVTLHEDRRSNKWYCLVIWQEAVGGILKGTQQLKITSNTHSLQNTADRNKLALKKKEAQVLVNRLASVPAWVRRTPHTIFDVSEYIEEEVAKGERLVNCPAERETTGGNVLTAEREDKPVTGTEEV